MGIYPTEKKNEKKVKFLLERKTSSGILQTSAGETAQPKPKPKT